MKYICWTAGRRGDVIRRHGPGHGRDGLLLAAPHSKPRLDLLNPGPPLPRYVDEMRSRAPATLPAPPRRIVDKMLRNLWLVRNTHYGTVLVVECLYKKGLIKCSAWYERVARGSCITSSKCCRRCCLRPSQGPGRSGASGVVDKMLRLRSINKQCGIDVPETLGRGGAGCGPGKVGGEARTRGLHDARRNGTECAPHSRAPHSPRACRRSAAWCTHLPAAHVRAAHPP